MTRLFLPLVLAFGQVADKPSTIRITAEDEPGTPMIVAGKVIAQDGSPCQGVKVYVYHTDAAGRYRLPDGDGFRLSGTMWTDRDGRFEFRTVRPGPYPGAKSGEHFHFTLTEGGIPDHFARIDFYDDRPTNKLVVSVGKQGGSSRYSTDFAWKPDAAIKGQRLAVEFRVVR